MLDLLVRDGDERRAVSCEAILFDMDGTLLDSTVCVERVWRDWAVARGVDLAGLLEIAHGRQNPEIVRMVAPHLDVAVEEAILKQADESCREGIVAVPGAHELLATLPVDSWAIVTSAWKRLAEIRLSHTGLPVPPVLVTADDISRGKPRPDCYLHAAERLAVDPQHCLVIEDAPAGIEAGLAAGMMVLAITTTFPRSRLRHPWCIDNLRAITLQNRVGSLRA